MSATKSSLVADQAEVALAEIERIAARIRTAHEAVAQVIFGQPEVIEQTLIAILSGGHALLIGVPGLAKTRLVQTLGTVLPTAISASLYAMVSTTFLWSTSTTS